MIQTSKPLTSLRSFMGKRRNIGQSNQVRLAPDPVNPKSDIQIQKSVPLVIVMIAAWLCGCIGQTIQTSPQTSPAGDPPQLTWSDWGLILSQSVVQDRVDYKKILADPTPLDRLFALLARVGPTCTPDLLPDRNSRLAYYINAYNAAVVRSVILMSRDGRVPRDAPLDLEYRYRFVIDGRSRTPAELRQMAMDLAGDDWRVALALCDGRRGSPPLHPRPMIGDLLDGQLDFVTRMALYAPHVIQVSHGAEKRLLVWRGLYRMKDRMIADYERRMGTTHATLLNVLGEWANRKRREELNTAVGYKVAEMPYDNLINQAELPPRESAGLLGF